MKRCEANDYWYFCDAAAVVNEDSTLLGIESLWRKETKKWKWHDAFKKKKSCEFGGAETFNSEWIQLNHSLISGVDSSPPTPADER